MSQSQSLPFPNIWSRTCRRLTTRVFTHKDVASTNGVIESQYSVLYGSVAIIFLVSGLQLSPQKLRQNLTNWRLHILTQGISFVVIPVIWLGERRIFPPANGPHLRGPG